MAGAPRAARVATVTDTAEIGRLLHRFQGEYASFTPGAEVLAQRAAAHLSSGASGFVLAGAPDAGVAQLRFREYLITGEIVCTLEELYVAPEHRRHGHGRAIMDTAFRIARQHAATSMELNTSADDTAARAFYTELGFTNLERAGDEHSQMLYYEREL